MCILDFAATSFPVLMTNEWIHKVLVPSLNIHNHKIKLVLNLRKTQCKFKSTVHEYFYIVFLAVFSSLLCIGMCMGIGGVIKHPTLEFCGICGFNTRWSEWTYQRLIRELYFILFYTSSLLNFIEELAELTGRVHTSDFLEFAIVEFQKKM